MGRVLGGGGWWEVGRRNGWCLPVFCFCCFAIGGDVEEGEGGVGVGTSSAACAIFLFMCLCWGCALCSPPCPQKCALCRGLVVFAARRKARGAAKGRGEGAVKATGTPNAPHQGWGWNDERLLRVEIKCGGLCFASSEVGWVGVCPVLHCWHGGSRTRPVSCCSTRP